MSTLINGSKVNEYIYCRVKGQWVHFRAWKTHKLTHSVGVCTSESRGGCRLRGDMVWCGWTESLTHAKSWCLWWWNASGMGVNPLNCTFCWVKSRCSGCQSWDSAWKSLHFFVFSLEIGNVFANFRLKNQEFAPQNVGSLWFYWKKKFFLRLLMLRNDNCSSAK